MTSRIAGFKRHLLFFAILGVAMVHSGCFGNRSETEDSSMAEQTEVVAPVLTAPAYQPRVATAPSVEPTPNDVVMATLAGDYVPSKISIRVVPGFGFKVGDELLTIEKVDRILDVMARNNIYADVQLLVPNSARATMLVPILDLCQKHDLVNVSISGG